MFLIVAANIWRFEIKIGSWIFINFVNFFLVIPSDFIFLETAVWENFMFSSLNFSWIPFWLVVLLFVKISKNFSFLIEFLWGSGPDFLKKLSKFSPFSVC
jgi:hypothetical protein